METMTLVLASKDKKKSLRWDLQNKIENSLISMDLNYPGELKLIHLVYVDPDGIEHDYYLEIQDESEQESMRHNH